MRVIVTPIVLESYVGMVLKSLGKRLEELEIRGKIGNEKENRDRPDYSIVKIGQNIEKSPRDLKWLAVIQTPGNAGVKNSQVMKNNNKIRAIESCEFTKKGKNELHMKMKALSVSMVSFSSESCHRNSSVVSWLFLITVRRSRVQSQL